MKVKQHKKKHGHQLHRPVDAYELYELEHMPNMLVKLPSYDHRPKPRAHSHSYSKVGPSGGHDERIFRPDYSVVGPPGGHNEGIFRPDYYDTDGSWNPPSDGQIVERNIDDEAEKFIRLEHERFAPSKWM